jgi:hypothetical protein
MPSNRSRCDDHRRPSKLLRLKVRRDGFGTPDRNVTSWISQQLSAGTCMDALMKSALIRSTRHAATWVLFPIYAAGTSTNILAAESAFAIDAGIGHTDNIGRTATDQRSAVISTAGAVFSFSDVTRRFEADISGNLEYQHYSADTYPGQIVGDATARGKLVVIPEHFEWKFAEYFGQTTLQQAEAITPSNRENINYFSTGPLLTVGLGSNNRLTMEGTYSKVDYQHADLNNQRYRGAFSVEHELSTVSKVSLNFESMRISYQDELLNPPSDQREAFVRYQATGARTTLALDAGYARVQQDTTERSSPVFRLDASRVTSRNSTLDILLGREFSDAGSLYKTLQATLGSNDVTQVVQPTSEPFTSTYGGIFWKIKQDRASLEFSISRYKQAYEKLSQFDQTRTAIRGDFSRQFTPTVQFYTSAVLWKSVYASEFGNTTDRNFVVGLAKRIGKQLALDLQYDRFDRTAVRATDASKANQVWLRIYYGSLVVGSGSLAPRFP